MKLRKNIIVSFIILMGVTFLFEYTFDRPTAINNFLGTYIYGDSATVIKNQIYVSNYSELSDAINIVNSTTTQYEIILNNDIILDSFIQIGTEDSSIIPKVILNLQSYSIVSKPYDYQVEGFGSYAVEYLLKNYGDLEIKATTGGMSTSSEDPNTLSDILIVNHNKLKINGGNYTDGCQVGTPQLLVNYADLTIENGNFTMNKYGGYMFYNEKNGNVTINNANFISDNAVSDNRFLNNGHMIINNINYDNANAGIYNNGDLEINDGIFNTGGPAIYNSEQTSSDYYENRNVTINGGKFYCSSTSTMLGTESEIFYNGGNLEINDGYFYITNNDEDHRVDFVYNFGIFTFNAGKFEMEDNRGFDFYAVRDIGDASKTYYNGGTFELKGVKDTIMSKSNAGIKKFVVPEGKEATLNFIDGINIIKLEKIKVGEDYFRSGDGTIDNPYTIYTIDELNNVRLFPTANYILMNDLDFKEVTSTGGSYYNDGKGWEPIGYWDGIANGDLDSRLRGVFDGNYHKIYNLNINRPDADYVGLFGGIIGTVKNLAIINSNIVGNNKVGSIAGYSWGAIEAVYTNNNVQGNIQVGGITGGGFGSDMWVKNSYNLGKVQGMKYVGGIVGDAGSLSTVYNCYNTGEIIGEESYNGIGPNRSYNNLYNFYYNYNTMYDYDFLTYINLNKNLFDNELWKYENISDIKRLPTLKGFENDYIDNINLNYDEIKVIENECVTLEANVVPKKEYNKSILYKIEDEDIAEVDSKGKITGLKMGNTSLHIFSLYDGFYKNVSVNVLKKYEVTYEPNGGSVEKEKFDVIYQNNYGDLEVPVKKGYTFKGWYLEEDFKNKVTKDTIANTPSNHILYAKWEINNYKLTIEPNKGEYEGDKEIMVKYNDTIEIKIPIRLGYIFKGWELTGTESTLNDATFKMGISDAMLKAKWEKLELELGENIDYIIKEDFITNVKLETINTEFDLGLNEKYFHKIVNQNNEEKKDGLLATGDKVEIYYNNTLSFRQIVVIKGDVSGDGKATVADYSKAYQYFKKRITMEDCFIEAADVVKKDPEITMADVSKIYQFIKKRIASLD